MSTATTEKTQKAEAPAEGSSRGDVAVFEAPRIPWIKAYETEFGDLGINRGTWRALVESVFPLAKTKEGVVLALSYCKARHLDPFKRVVHIVPIWDNTKKRYVETVWPGIAEHRTTAFRTGQYAGTDPANYGPMIEHVFSDEVGDKGERRNISMRFPEWCQITVYRTHDGHRVAHPGPRVYWREYYSRIGRSELPNDRWQRAPVQMLEKCAESAALRRAFPEELGDEATVDEIGTRHREGDVVVDVTPRRPTRAEFEERPEPFIVTTGDGEIREFEDPAIATEALLALFHAAPDLDALDGVWESNTLPGQLRDRQMHEFVDKVNCAYRERVDVLQKKTPDQKAAELPKEPPSPLSLPKGDQEAAWAPWVSWFKDQLRAGDVKALAGRHAKELRFIRDFRSADHDAIAAILDERRG